MRLLVLCFAIFLFALTTVGCATRRPDRDQDRSRDRERQASIESSKNTIIERLIPEDGLTFTRRTRLIDATIAVLHKGDREELANLNRLRDTLRATSLSDLEKIETHYKEKLADGE
jgi:hypothetical protein